MVLAAMTKPRNRLAAVTGDSRVAQQLPPPPATPPADAPELAERLAAAQAAVEGPRQQVAELTAALQAAVGRQDYAEAARLQEQLPAAREALALAEVDVRVITERAQALAAETDAERRAVDEQQQRDEAQRTIAHAQEAGARARAQVDAAITEMWEHVTAAQEALNRALSWEPATREHAQRIIQANHVLGKYPPGHPGPAPARYTRASALVEGDELARLISRWDRR